MPEVFYLSIELVILTAGLIWLGRFAGGRLITALTLGAFAVRLALGETLYLISAWHLPFLVSKQMPGGFWVFAYDGYFYHNQAIDVLTRLPSSFPSAVHVLLVQSSPSLGFDGGNGLSGFPRLLAILYMVFGTDPSAGLLVVAAIAAAVVPMAYLMAKRLALSDYQAAVVGAIVAVWPSGLLWTSQLLREALDWMAAFAIGLGATMLLSRSQPRTSRGVVSAVVLIGLGVVWGVQMRSYISAAWLMAIVCAGIVFVLTSGMPHRRFVAVGGAALLVVLIGSIPIPGVASSSERLFLSATQFVGLVTGSSSPIDGITAANRSYLAAITGDPDLASKDPHKALQLLGKEPTPTATPLPAPLPPGITAEDASWIGRLMRDPLYAWEYPEETYRLGHPPGVPTPIPTPVPDPLAVSNLEAFYNSNEVCPAVAPLLMARAGFMDTGGGSQVDENVRLVSCGSVAAYIPRAAVLAFLEPLPNEWRRIGGQVGQLRYLTIPDAFLLWLFMPGFLISSVRAFRQLRPERLAVVIYTVLLGIALGLSVTNFGSLFRLRLAAILPSVVLAVEGYFLIWTWSVAHGFVRRLRLVPSQTWGPR